MSEKDQREKRVEDVMRNSANFVVRLAEIVALTAAFTAAALVSLENGREAASAVLALFAIVLNFAVIHFCVDAARGIADRDIERFKPSKSGRILITLASVFSGCLLSGLASLAVSDFVKALAS